MNTFLGQMIYISGETMRTFLLSAFKTISDEEILDTIIQFAWDEMTPIHINQTQFIFIE